MAENEENKVLYTMTKENDSSFALDFFVVQSLGYSFENSILTYESVGSDGGWSVNTGTITQEVPVTIQLVDNLSKNLEFMKKIRDEKEAVSIFGKINGSNLFGQYLISKGDLNIIDGADSMMMNVTFREYRNVTLQTVNLTFPKDKSAASIIEYMKIQNRIDKS